MEIRRKLSITGEYEEADVGYIIDQLVSFNLSNAPTAQVPPSEDMNLMLRDQDGLVLGGVLGKVYRFAL